MSVCKSYRTEDTQGQYGDNDKKHGFVSLFFPKSCKLVILLSLIKYYKIKKNRMEVIQ